MVNDAGRESGDVDGHGLTFDGSDKSKTNPSIEAKPQIINIGKARAKTSNQNMFLRIPTCRLDQCISRL